MKPAARFHNNLNKSHFLELYSKFIEGGSAVGRDGVRIEKFGKSVDQEIDLVIRKIRAGTYRFTAYREKLISKGAGRNPRQISVPTIRDKLVLKFISELLAEIYPEHVSQPPHHFIKKIHRASMSRPHTDFYLRLDIESYFPSINHNIMMRILRRTIRQKVLLNLIEDALKTPTGFKRGAGPRLAKGVPQGLSISNILSSLYLTDIDQKFDSIYGVNYFRFVDDILVIGDCQTTNQLSSDISVAMKSKRKIRCHAVGEGSKSTRVSLTEGIDYLGYNFQRDKIQVRSSSFKKMFSNLMKLFTAMKYRNNRGPLIWRMNLRIGGCIFDERRVGWLFFFSQTKNMQQLKQLDAFVSGQAKKVLQPGDQGRLKTFTKGYHEIRYNFKESRYFPNFDKFDDAQKRSQVCILLPRKSVAELKALSSEDLDKLFRKCISKEIGELEKDMMEVFS